MRAELLTKGTTMRRRSRQNEQKAALEQATAAFAACGSKISELLGCKKQLESQLAAAPVSDIAKTRDRMSGLTSRKNILAKDKEALHARWFANKTGLANISAKAKELKEAEARWTWLHELADTAGGSLAGKDKVMLETYVQMTYFDRIVARANTRFMVMSGGQYELRRSREAGSRLSQSGLDLNVVDHYNGTERSVRTLSGGESFMASLSLALGLSDEIQSAAGGIRLDSMFVDEGFGALDEEALQQALNALASLADGSRLVGVISHVAELKERIDRQIVVTKERAGGSSVRVIA